MSRVSDSQREQAPPLPATHPSRGRARLRLLSLLTLTGALAALAATASAFDVRGTLTTPAHFADVPAETADEGRLHHYWDEWNGFLERREMGFSAARDVGVVLVGEGPMAEGQPGFALRNGNFWPRTMVERTGAQLRIQNTDPCTHQLEAEGFEPLGPTPTAPGLTRQAQVAAAGHWLITDRLYAHVSGHLHVIDGLVARATIAEDGSYHFQNVPEGTYTLEVYFEENRIHRQEGVVVTDRELTLEPIALTRSAAE